MEVLLILAYIFMIIIFILINLISSLKSRLNYMDKYCDDMEKIYEDRIKELENERYNR